MKLKRLKLLSSFRGLNEGFEVVFSTNIVKNHLVEPICLIGLNGSGKSNLLEVIAEIFYYLEDLDRSQGSDLEEFESPFGFEIEYYLPKLTMAGAGYTWEDLGDFTFADLDNMQLIKIRKEKDQLPIISVYFNQKKIPIDEFNNNALSKILPAFIVGYSSGNNELLSNPFIKLNFEYFKEVKAKARDGALESRLIKNRFQFLDYNISKLITISNFIFDEDIYAQDEQSLKNLSLLKKELRIEGLESFKIYLGLQKTKVQTKYLPDRLEMAISDFKEIDLFFSEHNVSRTNYDYVEYKFQFNLDNATISAFRDRFENASKLFEILYFFELLNIDKLSRNVRNSIKNYSAGESENLSDLFPNLEIDKKLFHLGSVALKKDGIDYPIYYNQLSDGEHQLLQILGSIILMEDTSTLFLLDEPGTHQNPEWRSKFVWLLNECVKLNSITQGDVDSESEYDVREQEILITTHSPFLVSDSKKDNVIWLSSESPWGPKEVTMNTYGTSITKILREFFGGKKQIADLVWEDIEEVLKSNSIDELNEALSMFGDSPERNLILQKLNRLFLEQQNSGQDDL